MQVRIPLLLGLSDQAFETASRRGFQVTDRSGPACAKPLLTAASQGRISTCAPIHPCRPAAALAPRCLERLTGLKAVSARRSTSPPVARHLAIGQRQSGFSRCTKAPGVRTRRDRIFADKAVFSRTISALLHRNNPPKQYEALACRRPQLRSIASLWTAPFSLPCAIHALDRGMQATIGAMKRDLHRVSIVALTSIPSQAEHDSAWYARTP